MSSEIKITFAKSGTTLAWDPKFETLLDFAEKNGIVMDFGCRSGNCSDCVLDLVSGEVEYLWEPEVVPDEGMCLTCCTVPKTDVTLNA